MTSEDTFNLGPFRVATELSLSLWKVKWKLFIFFFSLITGKRQKHIQKKKIASHSHSDQAE